MKLGVFGGTFDPPHIGHLVIAQEVAWRLELDRLLLVPAAVSPHKQERPVTEGALRLEMLRAAVGAGEPADRPRRGSDRRVVLVASDIELRREGPSYTVDTLEVLREDHPEAELFLVIGADQAAVFDSWRGPDRIRELATVVGLEREGEGMPGGPARGFDYVHVPRLDISSTEIRRRVAAGEPIRYLVPDPVLEIIEREGLYR